jgi:hypothetical protein
VTADANVAITPCLVVRIAEPTVDVVSLHDVDRRLRSVPPSAPLVVDWSDVVYVDLLGMETVFDFLLDRAAPTAFAGLSRDLDHLLLRLQLRPVLPRGTTVDDAAAAIGCSR